MTERELFIAALQLRDSAARAAFLDQACGNDLALRARVDELLQEQEQLGDFLEFAVGAPDGHGAAIPLEKTQMADNSRPRMPRAIGPYQLLQPLGEGGMGSVYLAEQSHPVQRRVALKIIKAGLDSAQVLARFEAERQALALMDHPHIAKVLDAGTTADGRPYFAMELVKGVSLTQYCDDNHLTVHERVQLFLPVCQAVQHAHQKGIIHRDLKPSNVLVTLSDGQPVAKIIDFGVAKAIDRRLTDRTMFTEYGQVVGTLEYMSPEQAGLNALDIDTRSDIYSLGVLLYELLTGSTPLEHQRVREAALTDVLRLIREQDPPRPSTRLRSSKDTLATLSARRRTEPAKLAGLLCGELDWIILKALEKDRARRYQTANGLARDLQRHLADEPVEACPPSTRYRLAKFARKNRAVLLTAVAFAALLISGAVISTWQAARARSAEAAVRKERDAVARAREEAEAINRFLTEDLLGQAAPEENGRDKRVTVEQVLAKAAAKIENNPKFVDQPEIEARLRLAIGNTYSKLGDLPEAEKHLRRALALRQKALGEEDPATLAAQEDLAWVLVDGLRQSEEVEALCERTWQARQRVLGPLDPDTLNSMDTYVTALVHRRRLDVAEPLARQCYQARESVLGKDHRDTLISLGNLGALMIMLGRWPEAERLERQCLESKRLILPPDHADFPVIMNNLAVALFYQGQLKEAEQWAREGSELAGRVLGPQHVHTLILQTLWTRVLADEERYEDAEKLGRRTLLAQRQFAPDHEMTGRSLLVLGQLLVHKGQLPEAESLLREADVLFRTRYAAKPELAAEAQNWVGACLVARQSYTEAERLLLPSWDVLQAATVVSPRQRRLAARNIVRLYQACGKPERASFWRAKLDAAARTISPE
jgi:serine/threonine protein kinase